jgi:hypothetical protein
MPKYQTRDTLLLSGWLFADLLLGLAIIFMVSLPGAQKPPTPPPPIIKWSVTPTTLSPTSSTCQGGLTAPQCVVTLTESPDSQASLNWHASSDMANNVNFSATNQTLSAGHSVQVKLSHFPCENGSFIFTRANDVPPLMVNWTCKLPPEKLRISPTTFNITIDPTGLLSNSSAAINDAKQQILAQNYQPGSVGLAIVYGGAPTDNDIVQAQSIADEVYSILTTLGKQPNSAFRRATHYKSLYNLGPQPDNVQIDVYLFQT